MNFVLSLFRISNRLINFVLLLWLLVLPVNVYAQAPTDEELEALERQIEQQETEQAEAKKRAEVEAKRKADEEAKKQIELEKQRAAEEEARRQAEEAERQRLAEEEQRIAAEEAKKLDISGTWKGTSLSGAGAEITSTYTIEQEGNNISGRLVEILLDGGIADTPFDGHIDSDGNVILYIRFEGTVSTNQLKLTSDRNNLNGTWSNTLGLSGVVNLSRQ